MMKKRAFALILALMLALTCTAQAEKAYRMLKLNSVGDDVKALKLRLYDLGYFRTSSLSDVYTDSTEPAVEAFQYMNGLVTTGVADSYTQAVLFSDAAIMADGEVIDPDAPMPEEGAGGDGQYRDMEEGCYGDDVMEAKRGLLKAGLYKDVKKEFQRRGCYFLNEDEKKKVRKTIIINGALNAKIVGQKAATIAALAGV